MSEMPKFRLKPFRPGYNFQLGRRTITTETQGGPPRQRRDSTGVVHRLTPTYKCTRVQYEYLINFLTAYEALPFLAYLVLDNKDHQWYKCREVSATLPVGALGDQIFTVQLNIVAEPLLPSVQAALAHVKVYDATDGNPKLFYDLIEQIVNKEMPEALGDL